MPFVRDEAAAQIEDSSGASITHERYRALVMGAAMQLAKGRKPSTKDMWNAKILIDRELGMSGRHIEIPGAAPGRRTI